MPDKRNNADLINALKQKDDITSLWQLFPDYTLAPDLNGESVLVQNLKKSYEARSVRLRSRFLGLANTESEKLAGHDNSRFPMSIAEDLFRIAGPRFEEHLRNISIQDLYAMYQRKNDGRSLHKLRIFFKPRESFDSRSWESMESLLKAAWEWARKWDLDHYCYIHFAVLALIEGYWLTIPEPISSNEGRIRASLGAKSASGTRSVSLPVPASNRRFENLYIDPRTSDDFIFAREPDIGWSCAVWEFDKPALIEMNEKIPSPPIGFPIYRGAFTYEDAADPKLARSKYIDKCQNAAELLINSSMLAGIGGVLREKIIEEIRATAKEYAERVDREFNKRKEPSPGRFHRVSDRDIKWAVDRVILRQDWGSIARRSRVKKDRVEKAVRSMLKKISLPGHAAFFGKTGGKKMGKSDA